MSLDEPGKPHFQLIADETFRWDGEDLCEDMLAGGRGVSRAREGFQLTVQFFQSELLGLADETEDHKPGDKVEPSVETD